MSTMMSMRWSRIATPSRNSAVSTPAICGAGRSCEAFRLTTSDTPSTTMPMVRGPMLITMTMVLASYSALPTLKRTRRSTTGTTAPRRFMTPLMNAGMLAMRVTRS